MIILTYFHTSRACDTAAEVSFSRIAMQPRIDAAKTWHRHREFIGRGTGPGIWREKSLRAENSGSTVRLVRHHHGMPAAGEPACCHGSEACRPPSSERSGKSRRPY